MPKIEHVAMYCHNLETIREFYEKFFGCKSGEKYTNSSKGFESYFLSFKDGARLEIMSKIPIIYSIKPTEHLGLTHIAISFGNKEKVDNLTNSFLNDGYDVVGNPRITGDEFYESVVLDPEMNGIEITV